MRELRWTTPAVDDLAAIERYVALDNPRAATRVSQKIIDRCRTLRAFPEIGRVGIKPGTRELTCPGLPYIAVYLVDDRGIAILRVVHGAQDTDVRLND